VTIVFATEKIFSIIAIIVSVAEKIFSTIATMFCVAEKIFSIIATMVGGDIHLLILNYL
jgi:phage-related protein